MLHETPGRGTLASISSSYCIHRRHALVSRRAHLVSLLIVDALKLSHLKIELSSGGNASPHSYVWGYGIIAAVPWDTVKVVQGFYRSKIWMTDGLRAGTGSAYIQIMINLTPSRRPAIRVPCEVRRIAHPRHKPRLHDVKRSVG